MNPNVFAALNVPAVNTFVGDRIYRNGRAPQGVQRPYITWQVVGGGPGNNLSCDPDHDDLRVRVWSYSDETQGERYARNLAQAVSTALEAATHVIAGPFDEFEAETRMLVWIQDAQFLDRR